MSTKRRRRHSPEQIVKKLRDADAMLNAGKDMAAVLLSRQEQSSLPKSPPPSNNALSP